MADEGYIKLYRSIWDHPLFDDGEPMTKGMAWIRMISEARYKEGEGKKYIKGKPVVFSRGEFPGSLRFLRKMFRWGSTTKVESYLKLLESDGMIRREKRQGQWIITLLNFDTYNQISNDSEEKKDTEKDRPKTDQRQHESRPVTDQRQTKDKPNKDKKGEEGGEGEESKEESTILVGRNPDDVSPALEDLPIPPSPQVDTGQNGDPKKEKSTFPEERKAICELLNETTGKNFRHDSKKMLTHVPARIREGWKFEDFKYVIQVKTLKWKGTTQEDYLRPETLFGPKFEGYRNETVSKEAAANLFWQNLPTKSKYET